MQRQPVNRIVLLGVGAFALFSVLWILLTDRVLLSLTGDPSLLTRLSSIKGIVYIIIISVGLYVVLRRLLVNERAEQQKLQQAFLGYQSMVENAPQGIWQTDVDGKIIYVNQTLCNMLSYSGKDFLGRSLSKFLDPSSEADFKWSVAGSQRPQQMDLCLLTRKGVQLWVVATFSTLANELGETIGSMGMAVEITERKQAEAALMDSEVRYRYLFENSPLSLWEEDFSEVKNYLEYLHHHGVTNFASYIDSHPETVDEYLQRARIIDVNQATILQQRAITKQELLGDLTPILGMEGRSLARQELLALAAGKTDFSGQGVYYRQDGARMDVLVRWSAAPGHEQDLDKVIVSVLDITDQLRVEDQLKAAEARYRMLVEQVSAVMYTDRVDDYSSAIYMSPQIEALTGYTGEEWISDAQHWQKSIHPDDREVVERENLRTNRTGEPFDIEYRMIRKDGRVVWIHDQAVLRWDNQRREAVWQGVLIDITKRKQAEEALQQSEARFRLLLQNQGEGTLLFKLDGSIAYVNPAAENLFGVDSQQMENMHLGDFMSSERIDELVQSVRSVSSEQKASLEIPIESLNGETRILLMTVTPSFETSGVLSGGLAVCRDITQRKQDESRLRYQSTHDALTGIYNRHYFEDQLAQLAQKAEFPFSLIVADVDGLKRINDSQGHPQGDELLRRVAKAMKDACRYHDVVARIGGDEFAILLPGANEQSTLHVLDRLGQNLQKANSGRPDLPIEISVGLATSDSAESQTTMFYRADQAMYAQKAMKRSQVKVD